MEVFLKEKSGFPLPRMPTDPVGVPSFLLQAWGWQLVPPATRVAEWQTLHPVIPMETLPHSFCRDGNIHQIYLFIVFTSFCMCPNVKGQVENVG